LSDGHKPHDNTYIGSHDIAAICGVHPWRTAVGVFMRMKGLADDPASNEAMRRGLQMEPTILRIFAEENAGLLLQEQVHARDEKHEWIGSTIDGLVLPDKTLGVDAKNVRFKGEEWGDPGTDEVPDYILVGMQWHIHNHRLEKVKIAALFSGADFHEYVIERHDDLIGSLLERAFKFKMDHLDANMPPDLDSSEDSKRFIRAAYPKDMLPLRAATAQEWELARQLYTLEALADQYQDGVDTVKNQLKALIGEAAGIAGRGFQLTYKKSRDTSKIDWGKVASECAGVVDPLTYQKILDKCRFTREGSRRFLPKFDASFGKEG